MWGIINNIKKDTIINSFFHSRITFSMSEKDDEKFKFPEKIDKVDSIYDNYKFCLNELP